MPLKTVRGGQDPILLYARPAYGRPARNVVVGNTDLLSPIYYSTDPTLIAGLASTIPPLGYVAFDGAADVWASTLTPGTSAVADVIPGGLSWAPSAVSIAEQIAIKGITVNVQSNGATVIILPGAGSDGTSAILAAIAAASPGDTLLLLGQCQVSSPIVIPPWITVIGYGTVINNSALSDNCTTLIASASFSGGSYPVPAVILMIDQITGGYSQISAGQNFQHINVDCSLAPSGTVSWASFGQVYGVGITDCCGQFAPATGLLTQFDAVHGQADGWRINGFMLARCGRNVDLNIADLIANDIHAIGASVDDNFFIRNAVNSHFFGARAGNSARYGWNFSVNQAAVGSWCGLHGCSSDQSGEYGLFINYGSTGGMALCIDGYCSDLDNATGTQQASALRIASAPQAVVISSIMQVSAAAACKYGLSYSNAANLAIGAGVVQGSVAGLIAGSGNGTVEISPALIQLP